MKSLVPLIILLIISIQISFGQTKCWESPQEVRISSPKVVNAIKNSNLSATNFDNDGVSDFIFWGRDGVVYNDSLPYFKISSSLVPQTEIASSIDYKELLPSNFGNFEIQDSCFVFLGFAGQPLKADKESSYNEVVIGLENNEQLVAILIGTVSNQGKLSFDYYDAATPYIFLSSGDYDDDGLSEFLMYDPNSNKLQLWKY